MLGGSMFILECWYNFLVQSCIMRIDNQNQHIRDIIQHFLQGDLGHSLGCQFILKSPSCYALVEGQQSRKLLVSTVILIVPYSKPAILYESSILSCPLTLDITLILFTWFSVACCFINGISPVYPSKLVKESGIHPRTTKPDIGPPSTLKTGQITPLTGF